LCGYTATPNTGVSTLLEILALGYYEGMWRGFKAYLFQPFLRFWVPEEFKDQVRMVTLAFQPFLRFWLSKFELEYVWQKLSFNPS